MDHISLTTHIFHHSYPLSTHLFHHSYFSLLIDIYLHPYLMCLSCHSKPQPQFLLIVPSKESQLLDIILSAVHRKSSILHRFGNADVYITFILSLVWVNPSKINVVYIFVLCVYIYMTYNGGEQIQSRMSPIYAIPKC